MRSEEDDFGKWNLSLSEDTENRINEMICENSISDWNIEEVETSQFDEMACFLNDLDECHNEEKYLKVLQFDGMDDCSDNSVEPNICSKFELSKTVFGINCEEDAIIQIINFLRSFNFLWIALKCHSLCVIDESCFFCVIRSSSLRLRQERKRGPFLIKLNEFICNIDQYQSVLKFDFMQNLYDVVTCIEKTLQLIQQSLGDSIGTSIRRGFCQKCSNSQKNFVSYVNIEKKADADNFD